MAEVEVQMMQLVNLAIGNPEVGAVNFNLLQKVLMEMLRMTDLDSATIKLSASDAANIGEISTTPQDQTGAAPPEERRESKRIIGCGLSPDKAEELVVGVSQLKMDYEDLKAKVEAMLGASETTPFQEIRASVTKIDGLQDKMAQIENLLERLKDLDGDQDMPLGQRLIQIQKLVDLHEDQLTKVNSVLDEKLELMDRQIKTLEEDMGEMNEKINLTKLGSKKETVVVQDSKMSLSGMQDQTANINNLISRLSNVQHDLDNLTMMTNTLNEEGERKQMLIDALTEQIEMLKLAKADKTNMEDILAAKADMSQVHRKVSHDQFESKMEQLNTALEDAFNRLDVHEESWQEEVELLKNDLHNKLDKMEFSPLKDYVNEKLKLLQDKMKALAAQKREGLAAGSKRRIIRDVQCISCDNESVMKPENTFDEMMPPPPLPTQPSVKPYLSYKLDQVRKQQKKLPGRNLLHFEEMLQNPADPRLKNGSRSGEHIVNRFVGGSHTTTTPLQRITRTGNFFETWGPIITAVDTHQQPSVNIH